MRLIRPENCGRIENPSYSLHRFLFPTMVRCWPCRAPKVRVYLVQEG
jgi:hypothetical protein